MGSVDSPAGPAPGPPDCGWACRAINGTLKPWCRPSLLRFPLSKHQISWPHFPNAWRKATRRDFRSPTSRCPSTGAPFKSTPCATSGMPTTRSTTGCWKPCTRSWQNRFFNHQPQQPARSLLPSPTRSSENGCSGRQSDRTNNKTSSPQPKNQPRCW